MGAAPRRPLFSEQRPIWRRYRQKRRENGDSPPVLPRFPGSLLPLGPPRRTKAGNEVDLVLYGRAGFWAFEVKHAAAIRAALKGLKAFREDYPEAACRLLYRGRESLEIDGIRCLPCEDFLRGLVPGRPLP
jgi:hypothetical protein